MKAGQLVRIRRRNSNWSKKLRVISAGKNYFLTGITENYESIHRFCMGTYSLPTNDDKTYTWELVRTEPIESHKIKYTHRNVFTGDLVCASQNSSGFTTHYRKSVLGVLKKFHVDTVNFNMRHVGL